jgi:hypothetical protein
MKLVSKFSALFSLLVVTCCSHGTGESPKLPQSAAFGWQLKSVTATPVESAPETVRQLGFSRSWRAEYAGPGTAHVDLYELKSEAAGLEMTQRWRAAANTVTFFNARYFAVITWGSADRAALTALVGTLEKSLPGTD